MDRRDLNETTDVKSTLAYQTEPPGHHVVLFYTLDKQPPGTQRVCTDTDMASVPLSSPATAATARRTRRPAISSTAFPQARRSSINHHYLNASDEELRGQAAVNINFAEPGNCDPVGQHGDRQHGARGSDRRRRRRTCTARSIAS